MEKNYFVGSNESKQYSVQQSICYVMFKDYRPISSFFVKIKSNKTVCIGRFNGRME